jgi:hypothetical protein
MEDRQGSNEDDAAEELLRSALLDSTATAAVALRVEPLALCDTLTVIFHGRRDLGTIQTYVTHGNRAAGTAVAADELLRVPCDLDLADATDRDDAEHLYAEQAALLRDAMLAADTVLAVWREPLSVMTGASVVIDRSIELGDRLPAHRLMPVALVAPERRLTIAPVCAAGTLAAGRPPLGIACAQQDLVRVYRLRDDPERCLEEFLGEAAEHARALADQLHHQATSVERFLELNDEDRPA